MDIHLIPVISLKERDFPEKAFWPQTMEAGFKLFIFQLIKFTIVLGMQR